MCAVAVRMTQTQDSYTAWKLKAAALLLGRLSIKVNSQKN